MGRTAVVLGCLLVVLGVQSHAHSQALPLNFGGQWLSRYWLTQRG